MENSLIAADYHLRHRRPIRRSSLLHFHHGWHERPLLKPRYYPAIPSVPFVPFLPSPQNHSMPDNQDKTAIQSSHEKPSRTSRGRKMLKIIVLLILELGAFYVGPCTNYLRKIFYRIYSADVVIDRQGNLSMEQRTLTLSITTRKRFCYDPFTGAYFDYGKKKHTYVYSLVSPPANTKISDHRIVVAPTAERFGEIRWSMTDDNHRLQEYAPLFFPTMSPDNFKSIIYIHPDDIHDLEKPFLLQSGNQFQANTALVIPYKIVNGIYFFYTPADSKVLFRQWWNRHPNFATSFWQFILMPPALILDMILLPLLLPFWLIGSFLFAYGISHAFP